MTKVTVDRATLASISTDGFFILQTTIVHPESACFQGFPLN